jgi:L-serine dehydratase
MIGPSSSHTAGAVKIGNMARQIFNKDIVKVIFYLHGSFAKTYQGHGTDKALLAGVMGMKPDAKNIKFAFDIATEKGIEFEFIQMDLGEVHPNTVKILLYNKHDVTHRDDKVEVTGSSIGGGKISITRINTFDVEIDGEYPTIVTKHFDRAGMISKITSILSDRHVNIAFMKVFRHIKGEKARLLIQTDEAVEEAIITDIKNIEGVVEVKFIESLKL